jgi:uncharacterized protein (TIGR00645 family)
MIERLVERLFFASRWLLAPIYLGLSIALIVLGFKFFQELIHTFLHMSEWPESDVVLSLLALVDISLVGGLIVMVMFSGYENFVSKLDLQDERSDNLGWLGKLDAGTLKLKVAASIVAISSIHLLRKFMAIEGMETELQLSKLKWYVIIHMTFVFSALLMGVLDRITSDSHGKDH